MPTSGSKLPSGLRYPGWFTEFLADRAVRKPSPHTVKAYRQDFEAIAILLAGTADAVVDLRADDLTKDTLRPAFAAYADAHSSASIRAVGRRGTRCACTCSPPNLSKRIRCR